MNLNSYKKLPKSLKFSDLIIHEDEDFVVINKPPFVSSLDERTADNTASILQMAREYTQDPQLCHRLDKETSGALIIAKNPEAYRHVAMQFENREIIKAYHAVVNGVHEFDNVSVYLPIAPLKNGTEVRIDRVKGKIAETIFHTLKVYQKHTLVQCLPISGRMHQIRVHLQCLKAPIVCDPTYGGDYIYLSELKRKFHLKKGTTELPLIKRVALHAHGIKFKLLSNEEIKIVAPYAKDFEVLIKQLDKV
ncbi:MAG: RluA family pseudouridine synthase [Spirosomaceae bacterium]|nr:RluA family pseudouridine synthase [Spirosomataceae bacterium]